MKKFYTLAAAALVAISASAANMQFTVNGGQVNNGDRINITNMFEPDSEGGMYNPHLMMTPSVAGEINSTCTFVSNTVVPELDDFWVEGGKTMIMFCSIDGSCVNVNPGETKTKTGPATAGKEVDMKIELKLDMGDDQTYEDLEVKSEFKLVTTLGGEEFTLTFYVDKGNGAGVDGVIADDSEAVYYNLQGVKVAEPKGGVYVKRCGGKAEKVIL